MNYLPGDMDDNSEINIFDVLNIVDIVLINTSPNDYQLIRADVNFDGVINIDDVLSLVNQIIAQ